MQLLRILKKFSRILSRHQKFRILELSVLMVIGGFLELCSVSLILPFMEAVLDPDGVMGNTYVERITILLGIQSYRTFLVFLALVLALLYIAKNIFLLFNLNVQNRFVFNNQFETQRMILHALLSRPYEFFLGINSGEVLRVITNDTVLTFSLLTNILMLFSEAIVSITLIGAILVMSPVITISIGATLFLVVVIIMRVVRPQLEEASLKHQEAYASMNKWLLQSIQGVKAMKVMRKESFFEQEYNRSGQIYVIMNRRTTTLGQIPRFILEAVAMSSFLVIVASMIYTGMDLVAVIPVLSVVAMAAVRLLPSVNRISQCIGAMAAYEPYLDKMLENLQGSTSGLEQKKCEDLNGGVKRLMGSFSLNHVSYKYPNGERDVLDDASIKIEKGQSVGIVGVSGAGKTTVVDILLGLLKPYKGQVLIDDTDICADLSGWISQIGYIPQSIFILDGSIRQNIAFGVETDCIDDAAVWKSIKEAALFDFVENLPDGLDTELGERGVRLSGGQRQRIGIARALYTNPTILFFDEATSALDNETENAIMESINHLQRMKTIVIIAHRISTLAGCDKIYRVEEGKILQEG